MSAIWTHTGPFTIYRTVRTDAKLHRSKAGKCPYAAMKQFRDATAKLKSGHLQLDDGSGNMMAEFATADHADHLSFANRNRIGQVCTASDLMAV